MRAPPELVASPRKRYFAELSSPTIPTVFLSPGDPIPELHGEVVVKPSVSAGARDTGRFGPEAHDQARALTERIWARGGVALLQPYLSDVVRRGETAFAFFGGELSHVLRKRSVLRPNETAPLAHEGLGRQLGIAQAMFEDGLVVPSRADEAEVRFAVRVLAELTDRFGTPLFLRVDLVHDTRGEPVLMEVEAIDPLFCMESMPGASMAFAAAVRAS